MSINAMKQALEALECDKDPQGCWNVRCQLGKVCKNAAPPQRQPLTDDEFLLEAKRRGFLIDSAYGSKEIT